MGIIDDQLSIFQVYQEENRASTLKIRIRKFTGPSRGRYDSTRAPPDT